MKLWLTREEKLQTIKPSAYLSSTVEKLTSQNNLYSNLLEQHVAT